MPAFICNTCGTQYAPSEQPPSECAICSEERQYVGAEGQTWTTLEALARRHCNAYRHYEPGLIGVGTMPHYAIGQRALLVRTPQGNVLWDCIALLDQATIEIVRGLGGLIGIAISHPHYYTTMVEWSRAFNVPVHLHAADQQWIMRPDPCITLWDGDSKELAPGLTLIRCGGHFAGSTVLHDADGQDGRGVLHVGDNLQVCQDRRHVSFMRSYPNYIPLGAKAVERIAAAVAPYEFERIYGAFAHRNVRNDGKAAVARSADRYLRAIADAYP
jgi:glyoxylase-like metal-dependent hydrolase (beta-lactamase superfamily II)